MARFAVVYENDDIYAFRDISPAAPSHIVVIPKNRDGLTGLQAVRVVFVLVSRFHC